MGYGRKSSNHVLNLPFFPGWYHDRCLKRILSRQKQQHNSASLGGSLVSRLHCVMPYSSDLIFPFDEAESNFQALEADGETDTSKPAFQQHSSAVRPKAGVSRGDKGHTPAVKGQHQKGIEDARRHVRRSQGPSRAGDSDDDDGESKEEVRGTGCLSSSDEPEEDTRGTNKGKKEDAGNRADLELYVREEDKDADGNLLDEAETRRCV